MDELREKIIDIFYKAGLEHLIQSEEQPSGGKFCETCQNLAEPLCYATNAMLVVARQDLLALIASHTAKEVELIIEMRSQGIWYDLTDKKNDKMNKTTLTGCSVVPTRELIKLWEKLTGKKHKAWEATDVQPSGGVRANHTVPSELARGEGSNK